MKKTCNQCGKNLLRGLESKDVYGVCIAPECPNYALLQIPAEQMPQKGVLSPNGKGWISKSKARRIKTVNLDTYLWKELNDKKSTSKTDQELCG